MKIIYHINPHPPSLLLFLPKILPLLAASSLGKIPDLSVRTILLTLSFSNSFFSRYLFFQYQFSYSIPHELQRLPCQPFVILPHGLRPMLQGGSEFASGDFFDPLSHDPPHLLLLPILFFTLNPHHPGLLLIKTFAH